MESLRSSQPSRAMRSRAAYSDRVLPTGGRLRKVCGDFPGSEVGKQKVELRPMAEEQLSDFEPTAGGSQQGSASSAVFGRRSLRSIGFGTHPSGRRASPVSATLIAFFACCCCYCCCGPKAPLRRVVGQQAAETAAPVRWSPQSTRDACL